jgi:hypothetical protein
LLTTCTADPFYVQTRPLGNEMMREIIMKDRNRITSWILCAATALALFAAPLAGAQSHPAATITLAAQAPSETDIANTQEQLLKLLRLSPVLTSVVARDPSLLADQGYVERNNPELAQFLAAHPDIAKNPEFYLFSHLDQGHGRRDQALERAVWPDLVPQEQFHTGAAEVIDKAVPLVGLPVFFFIVFLIIRTFVESRRWSRTLKVQSEVHSKLIDKFSSSQDLAAYMQTEAGKRFLEASPVTAGSDLGPHMPNAVARILTPLSAGVVLVLAGIGFYLLRHAGPDMEVGMTVLGTLALMPGIGFILSAGATWVVAQRLGLLPEKDELRAAPGQQFNSNDRP